MRGRSNSRIAKKPTRKPPICASQAIWADMPDAPKILQRNVYGWFERIERGRYGLTEFGRVELERWTRE